MKRSRALWFSLFGFFFAASLIQFPEPLGAQVAAASSASDIVVQHDVPMKTRDGVTLYADIYRPNSPDKFPVILMRTPYDKSVSWAVSPVYQDGAARLRRHHSGRARTLYVGRRVVSVPARASRRLRLLSNGPPRSLTPMAKLA